MTNIPKFLYYPVVTQTQWGYKPFVHTAKTGLGFVDYARAKRFLDKELRGHEGRETGYIKVFELKFFRDKDRMYKGESIE